MKTKTKIIGLAAIIVVIVAAIAIVILLSEKDEEDKIKVGVVLSGAKDEAGWNGMHYEGVKKACEDLEVELVVEENVKEFSGECEKAIEKMAGEGVSMIILSSYNYSEEVHELVTDYPDIAFYVNSSEYHEKNMTSYFARMYQARYLSGILAGMKTQNGKVGYVAAMANNEVNRGISAFTLGVRSVNPKAKVIVSWSQAWDDETKEEQCAKNLINNAGVDVITYHQNGATVLEEAQKADIYSIGYHQFYEGYSDKYLTSVVANWDKVYRELIRECISNEANAKENAWIGMSEEAVGLSGASKDITKEEQEAIEAARNKIMAGGDVFSGLIYDTDNQIRCNEGEMISDKELLENFDWYVLGVEFYEE